MQTASIEGPQGASLSRGPSAEPSSASSVPSNPRATQRAAPRNHHHTPSLGPFQHAKLAYTQRVQSHTPGVLTPGVMVDVSIYKMVKDMRPSMEVLKAVFEVDKGLRMEEGWLFSPAPPSTSAPLYTCPDSVSGQSYLACKTWHVSVPWPRTHDCCLCITLLDLLGLFSCPSTSSRKPS